MDIETAKYGGYWHLEVHGYKENHLALESTQMFEGIRGLYEYLSYFFANETMTSRCDSYENWGDRYDIRVEWDPDMPSVA